MKPHPIADGLLLPTHKTIIRIMIEEEYVNKLNVMYISLDRVHRRIADVSADILDIMIQEMKPSILPIFSIKLDESTDVENGSQLFVYAKKLYNSVLKTYPLNLMNYICGLCTDGVVNMILYRRDFNVWYIMKGRKSLEIIV
ncbi:Zinc finger BED domain-containing protein 5 [Thelohanellus kitauei]|uniref:Zinc finger BED domain-containing protein 5 n=1 Tax=Thelohanellus kitauei TaxID=669202 RepID=A0A0C2JQ00_THEKT|nr:Zinc finger BED domain-containing protein 5 [Thelohanellus kitauei]